MKISLLVMLLILMVSFTCCKKNNKQTQISTSNNIEAINDTIIEFNFEKLDDFFSFMIVSDLGRNGYYDQLPVAETMGEIANAADVEFIAALGDVHHFMGIQSVHDPLWLTNFELVYKHPELMIPWYPILGNHEYEGNTNAVIAYSDISRRWQMPDRYYQKMVLINDTVSALLLFIDTTPLIDKYHVSNEHPDVHFQLVEKQLKWIDKTLKESTAKWKIVMGHHPIFAGTTKTESERNDLQIKLLPILNSNNVNAYFNGHIHNFQHIKTSESEIHFFVNSSASQSRNVISLNETVFGSSSTGFILCSLDQSEMIISFVNKDGEIIYQYKI